jgi:hypothetical protein
MIGVTRETETRVMAAFKKRNLRLVKGTSVNICDRAGLRNLAPI